MDVLGTSDRRRPGGLTKESARLLLAQRLRHGRLKLVWVPSYKAAKKETKEEESVQEVLMPWSPMSLKAKVDEHVSAEDQDTPNEQVHQNVMCARTDDTIVYVNRRSCHVVPSRLIEPFSGRMKYIFQLLCLFWLMPHLAVGAETTAEKKEEFDVFGMALYTGFIMVLSTAFLVGRWSCLPGRPTVTEVGLQKDEPVVHSRLREELAKAQEEVSLWRNRAVEFRPFASESRAAADMVLAYQCTAENLLSEASDLLRQCLRQMVEHSSDCPFFQKIWMTRHGQRWHASPEFAGRDRTSFRMVERCHLCSIRMLPPDHVAQRDGESARVLVHRWLDEYKQRLME